MMPIMQFISNMGYVGVAVVGGILAINGKINIGDIQAFIQYMNQFTQPLSQVANISNIYKIPPQLLNEYLIFYPKQKKVMKVKS